VIIYVVEKSVEISVYLCPTAIFRFHTINFNIHVSDSTNPFALPRTQGH